MWQHKRFEGVPAQWLLWRGERPLSGPAFPVRHWTHWPDRRLPHGWEYRGPRLANLYSWAHRVAGHGRARQSIPVRFQSSIDAWRSIVDRCMVDQSGQWGADDGVRISFFAGAAESRRGTGR